MSFTSRRPDVLDLSFDSRRSAFTLIEIVVTIGIISILFALLLVAVQRARESARRATCQANIRQVGIALQHYHEARGVLPPAFIWEPPGEPLGNGELPIGVIDRVARFGTTEEDTVYANWLIMILPYLEQQILVDQFDTRFPISHQRNATARAIELPVLKCPSDANNGADNQFQRGLANGLEDNHYARGNFAINGGPDGVCAEGTEVPDGPCVGGFITGGGDLMTMNDSVWGSGVAGVNKSFRMSDMRDGTSTTVAVDEIRAGVHPLDPRGVWALGQVGSSVIARHGKYDAAGGPNNRDPDGDAFMGCRTLIEVFGERNLESQYMSCLDAPAELERNVQIGARSMHPDGVNVLMCDGAVRFIQDGIDLEVWHALHTRDRGENFDSPF